MKKKLLTVLLMAVACVLVLTACGAYDAVLFDGVDFASSPFKHITNGGKGGDDPYNISAITGATLTIEGPGMKSSVPLSTKELENSNDGLVRGVYKDKTGKHAFEGIDVYYLLNSMSEGDSGIVLTDTAHKVVFKNANRETVAELTLKEIEQAHNDKQPVMIAYGMGTGDCRTVAPFVFSGANAGEHTKGYIDTLNNEDGCLKLVYNSGKYGSSDYRTFSNCAYLYVAEETTPGFKHTDPDLLDYVISVGGKTLGYELDFTVEQLEYLVNTDKDGNVTAGGLGYQDFYSLANNTYWYVNEYQGLDLYKFLQYVGVPDARTLGDKAAKTDVTFSASDGYTSAEKFNMAQLADYDNFGFYKKNSADLDDGNYKPTNADLVKTGYPVMLAYGVNEYPYTIKNGGEGYVSGISNNGGPMRVIFGKTGYGHANGSNQIQYLSNIVVGANFLLQTHSGTREEELRQYADNEMSVLVKNVDGSELTDEKYTVKQFEDLLYGEDATSNQLKAGKIKGLYAGDIYEGVKLEYFLSNVIGIPGTNGTVVFTDGKKSVTVELTDLFEQEAFIAFAKNGTPLVPGKDSEGYIAERDLYPVAGEPAKYKVENSGGPLMLVLPDKDRSTRKAEFLENVTGITVNVEPDRYAHLEGEAAALLSDTLTFTGDGVNATRTYTVSDLEGMQKAAKTLDFGEERYRGIPVYDLLVSTGIKYNANEVIFTSQDGTSETFKLGDLRGGEDKVTPIIAFGKGDVSKPQKEGAPLMAKDGGPLMLVTSDKKIQTVTKIEVTTIEMTSWDHSASDLYTEFLDSPFTVVVKTSSSEKAYEFTLKDLEGMTDLVERTDYSVLDLGTCEGINLWKLIEATAGKDFDISNPVSVVGYASDNYSKDFLAIFSLEQLQKGIVDANGQRKPIIICYAIQGYPLVISTDDEGYSGLVANSDGPIRFITETNQGASIKHANKVVITVG